MSKFIIKDNSVGNQFIGDEQSHQEHHHHYPLGAKPEFMENKTTNEMTIYGGTYNAPVGINQAFKDCYNSTQAGKESGVQDALRIMIGEVEKLHPQLDELEKSKAERKLKLLTDEAMQADPDKEQLKLSAKGLVEAAQTCAKMAPPVIIAVKAVLGLFGVALP
jgi:hypothetical protein